MVQFLRFFEKGRSMGTRLSVAMAGSAVFRFSVIFPLVPTP